MSHWESRGKSDEWYTPAYVFDALGLMFDLDVAAPEGGAPHVPARQALHCDGLTLPWHGLVWMNPPFGGRNGLTPWLDKFFEHGSGIALTPDRTSAGWWQDAARRADSILFVHGKIKFERPDGSTGDSPSCGTTLFATGEEASLALHQASTKGMGWVSKGWSGA